MSLHEQNKQRNRDRILTAADEIIRKDGLEALSMRHLADYAGVSLRTPYNLFGSKTVITGDITQVDLPTGRQSGLIEVQGILKQVDGIKFVYLSEEDVVRHELVQQIVRAYESYQPPASGAERR